MQICEYCGNEFKSKNKRQKCCSVECANKQKTIYKECEICWKTFHPAKKSQKYCSLQCCHEAQKKPLDVCPICWEEFRVRNSKQKYCSNICKGVAERTIERLDCAICGKEFVPKWERQKCCCREHAAQLRLAEKWFMWNCQSPNCLNGAKIISKNNLLYKEFLEALWYNVELEYPLWNYSFDLKIWNTLIEINPYPYHNSTWAPWWAKEKLPDYHYNKYIFAKKKWYKCIMVRDWTSNEELLRMINDKNFHYEWDKRLIWYNSNTWEYIIDRNFDEANMLSEWFIKIYDCGVPCFTKLKDI